MIILKDFLEFIIIMSLGFHPCATNMPLISFGEEYVVSKAGSNRDSWFIASIFQGFILI